ncbi:phospholipase D family protein [Salidesulfovibrio onnuriiensis]|uniref:phospholipase D family protein n=1 Tax=Salidesulfovibrio onnuriiensis TaxID=2583823 RepID=UPI0011CB1D8A|nr:phospholipase D family protein [Salidesulfovibrio onnuriiensis]
MRIITCPTDISATLLKLISRYDKLSWAVAWATNPRDIIDTLLLNPKKIRHMVVGLRFEQTSPLFIESFQHVKNVKYIDLQEGVFHPKCYLFYNNRNKWEALIGSSNLTTNAMTKNAEICVHLSSSDTGTPYDDIRKYIVGYWKKAWRLSKKEFENYKQRYERRNKNRTTNYMNDRIPAAALEQRLDWAGFVEEVLDNDYYDEMIKVLDHAQDLFKKHSFADFSKQDRRRIAGTSKEKDSDWGLFGRMNFATRFQQQVALNNKAISNALDAIPTTGIVRKSDYDSFIKIIKKGFPDGGLGISTATRLLAMKRPDYFICVSKPNQLQLANLLGVPKSHVYSIDEYWESVVETAQNTSWWADAVNDTKNKIIKKYKMALLDVLCYQGPS